MSEFPDRDDLGMIRRMISSRAHALTARSDSPQCSDYNWNVPNSFARPEFRVIQELGTRTAEKLCTAVGALLAMKLNVELVSVSQHYAEKLRVFQPAISGCWASILDDAGKHQGFVTLSSAKSLAWVSRRLGAAGPSSADRKMSSLEVSLVLDIFVSAVGAVSSAVTSSTPVKLQCERTVGENNVRIPDHALDEYCMFEFGVAGEKETSITILLLSRLAEILAGLAKPRDPKQTADTRNIMLSHINRIPINLTADIGEVMVTMRDIVQLSPGDIIPLAMSVDEPIPVFYDKKRVLSGWMASNEGSYAVKIASVAGAAAVKKK